MLGGKHTGRLRVVDWTLTLIVSLGMIFGSLVLGLVPTAHAVADTDNFEVGSQEGGSGSLSGLITGTYDWDDLIPAGPSFDPDDVIVLNDTGWTGDSGVINPATAEEVEASCPNTNDDDIIAGGTEIDDFPFEVVDGSVPGKVDLCQVYLSYGIDGDGDTILFVGALRRETNGTVAVAVELNRISHSQRTTDDLLITFEFDGNGPVSEILVRPWEGSAWGAPQSVESDGDSWEHFGEIRVNLSDSNILPPPQTADDCSSFSSILPYGFRGNSANSQVGDWLDPAEIRIPRCGELEIIKEATPPSGSLEFGWLVEDNGGTFADLSGDIQDGETVTLELVNGEYSLTENVIPGPYVLDAIECTGGFEPDAITIETGSSVTCTIFNEASSLEVEKVGEGDPTAAFTFSVTGQTDFDLSLGEGSNVFVYTPGTSVDISESLPSGNPAWASQGVVCTDDLDNVVASSGTAAVSIDTIAGALITCVFTNTQDGQVTVVKNVINDHGGQLGVGDFPLFLNGDPVSSGTPNFVPTATYTVSETTQPGYTQSGPVCIDDNTQANVGHPFDLGHGQAVTCTITNNDDPGSLTLLKSVDSQNGGQASDSDWTLAADGPISISGSEGDASVTAAEVSAGDYDLSESGGPDGWIQSGDWNCFGASMVDGDTVTVGVGESVTCEVTNTDIAPILTLIKDVQNNNGGNANTNDFTLTAAGPVTVTGVTGHTNVTNAEVPSGSYDLSEEGPLGYVQVGEWVCVGGDQIDGNTVDLGPGDVATCTVTNQDVAPGLTVTKMVNNNFGGDAQADDFQLRVNGSAVDQDTPVPGIVANTEYTVSEDQIDGYTQVGDVACVDNDTQQAVSHPVTLDEGQSVTCTITNEDLAPELTLVKVVINNFGGDSDAGDFQLTLNGSNTNQGAQTGVVSNTAYEVGEIQIEGYTQVGDVACVDDDTQQAVSHPATLDEGQAVTCTITNEDQPPGLVVIKEVINDFGGNAVPGDFQLRANGEAINQNEPLDVEANQEYTITEDEIAGYELVGIACEDSEGAVAHPVALESGQAVQCTVTNRDIAPGLTLVKEVINDHGGNAEPDDFQLTLNGENVDHGAQDGILSNAEYVLGEIQIDGYMQSGEVVCMDDDTQQAVDHPVTLGEGQAVTCTITNDDIGPGLIVVKEVINDDGGDAHPDDFTLRVNGDAVVQGDNLDVPANQAQTVTEDQFPGYELIGVSCVETGTENQVDHPVTLDEGDSVTCTVTNDDIAPQLTLVKEVINDDAGTATPSDFQLTLNGSNVAQGVVSGVVANTLYTLSETQVQGYQQSGDVVCIDDSTLEEVGHPVSLDEGQAVTCTVTNNDIPDEVLQEELPFTGMYATDLARLALALALSGLLALFLARSRDQGEGLGR